MDSEFKSVFLGKTESRFCERIPSANALRPGKANREMILLAKRLPFFCFFYDRHNGVFVGMKRVKMCDHWRMVLAQLGEITNDNQQKAYSTDNDVVQ